MKTKPTNPKDAIGSDKFPFHLWPQTATLAGTLAMLEGALKYGRSNYRPGGARASIYFDALLRHTFAWFEGEDLASDSQIDHLGHALACLAILVDAREAGTLLDDRMVKGGYNDMIKRLTPMIEELKKKYKSRNPKHWSRADNTATVIVKHNHNTQVRRAKNGRFTR